MARMPIRPASGRKIWRCRLAAVLAVLAGAAMAAPDDGPVTAGSLPGQAAGLQAAGLQAAGLQAAGLQAAGLQAGGGLADLPAAILAATVALGRDLSRPGVGPFAPLAPLVPLSRIRIVDQGVPLAGPRPGDLLSPGGWAGRVALDRIHAGRVIEVTGWWGGATLPLGSGRPQASRSGAAGPAIAWPGAITMSPLPGAGGRPVRVAGPAVLPGAGAIGFIPASGESRAPDGGPLPDVPLPDIPVPDVPVPVPLPASLVLLGGAVAALAGVRRIKPRRSRPG